MTFYTLWIHTDKVGYPLLLGCGWYKDPLNAVGLEEMANGAHGFKITSEWVSETDCFSLN